MTFRGEAEAPVYASSGCRLQFLSPLRRMVELHLGEESSPVFLTQRDSITTLSGPLTAHRDMLWDGANMVRSQQLLVTKLNGPARATVSAPAGRRIRLIPELAPGEELVLRSGCVLLVGEGNRLGLEMDLLQWALMRDVVRTVISGTGPALLAVGEEAHWVELEADEIRHVNPRFLVGCTRGMERCFATYGIRRTAMPHANATLFTGLWEAVAGQWTPGPGDAGAVCRGEPSPPVAAALLSALRSGLHSVLPTACLGGVPRQSRLVILGISQGDDFAHGGCIGVMALANDGAAVAPDISGDPRNDVGRMAEGAEEPHRKVARQDRAQMATPLRLIRNSQKAQVLRGVQSPPRS